MVGAMCQAAMQTLHWKENTGALQHWQKQARERSGSGKQSRKTGDSVVAGRGAAQHAVK